MSPSQYQHRFRLAFIFRFVGSCSVCRVARVKQSGSNKATRTAPALGRVGVQTCQARLGYVTGDGPEPSGKRYSINSLCVHHSLEPLEVAASEADWDPTAPQTPIDHAHCHAYDPVSGPAAPPCGPSAVAIGAQTSRSVRALVRF